MNIALKIVAVVVVGTFLGLFATWAIAVRGNMPGGVADGPWKTDLAIGSPQGDPYTRASVAIHGLFALNRSETVYYTATTDADGNALDGSCQYEITGSDPDARWWSITAYGPDDFLIPSPGNHFSVAKTTVARGADANFNITVGGAPKSFNWIATGAGSFSLTLRLYNPGPTVQLDPGNAVLPRLAKVSCS